MVNGEYLNIALLGTMALCIVMTGCNKKKTHHYFDGRMTIAADSDWIPIDSLGANQLENEKDGATVSFSLAENPDGDLDGFAGVRFDAVDKAEWSEVPFSHAVRIEYPKQVKKYLSKDGEHNYLVFALGNKGTFLSLTYVIHETKFDDLIDEMITITKSVKFR